MYLHEQFTKEREIGGREFGGGGVRLIANAGIVDFEGIVFERINQFSSVKFSLVTDWVVGWK